MFCLISLKAEPGPRLLAYEDDPCGQVDGTCMIAIAREERRLRPEVEAASNDICLAKSMSVWPAGG